MIQILNWKHLEIQQEILNLDWTCYPSITPRKKDFLYVSYAHAPYARVVVVSMSTLYYSKKTRQNTHGFALSLPPRPHQLALYSILLTSQGPTPLTLFLSHYFVLFPRFPSYRAPHPRKPITRGPLHPPFSPLFSF